MRIGFWKEDITPDIGVELGGYAGYRPCTGIHDRLWCRCVVLEQEGVLHALVQLDLMCAEEPLCRRIGTRLSPLGVQPEHLIVTATHSHSAPCGVIPGEGLMGEIALPGYPADDSYGPYLEKLLDAVFRAAKKAMALRSPFQLRWGSCPMPPIGSERHTGEIPEVMLTAAQIRCETGRKLILYHFPCHPTVMGPGNLQVTADLTAGIEAQLDGDMAIFLNGAAGDISTRYTRSSQTFQECDRLGAVAAEAVRKVLKQAIYEHPKQIIGVRGTFFAKVRPVEPVEEARNRLEEMTAQVEKAQAEGADSAAIRMLKSYAEGALINLQFAGSLGKIREILLDICAFRMGDRTFATIPGELFSTLIPRDGTCIIGYANGYHLYIADSMAYEKQYYEALASQFARGEGERLMEYVNTLLEQLEHK